MPRVRPRDAEADVLQQALLAFDRARSWEESRAARDRLLGLGPEVLPSALAELEHGQCPDRFDLLLALYVKWASPDETIALATSESTGWVLRSALAEGLGRFADIDRGTDARTVERIAACLARLARDADVGTRIAAVEAVGISRMAITPELRGALEDAAASDSSESVREEARMVLAELTGSAA